MTFRRKGALGAVGILAAVVLTGCVSSPGPGTTKSWCDHGNRLYSLDTEETKGETLTVVPDDPDCPADESQDVTISPEGDTRPMPEVTAMLDGPYKPWKPSPKPGPKPNAPKVSPRKAESYRIYPEAR
jgi:hypothetical protein